MEGQETAGEQAKTDQELGVMNLNVSFEIQTGIVKVEGHIGNTDLCMKILIEAAHIILVTNAEADKKRMQAQAANLEVISNAVKNGKGENAPPPAAN